MNRVASQISGAARAEAQAAADQTSAITGMFGRFSTIRRSKNGSIIKIKKWKTKI